MCIRAAQSGNRSRVIISQILPVMVKNLLLVGFGMTSGYPTILIPSFSDPKSKEEFTLNEEQISWIGSINVLVVPLGCLLSGIVSQAIGRKITMQVSCVLTILAWVIFRFCNDVWQIYCALAIFGLTGGLLESPVLTYVAEITEPRLRGSLLCTGPLAVTLGLFLEFFLGSIFNWKNVPIYSAIAPLTALILLFIVPESPYWLLSKNRLEEARKSLAWVRGWTTLEKIEDEFQDMLVNYKEYSNINRFKLGNYTEPRFTRPFALLCYLFLLYNFTGLATIPVYAIKIFQTLEVPIEEYTATVILGLTQFLGCLICVFTIPHTGKRVQSFISITVSACSITIVAVYAYMTNIRYLYSPNEITENILLDHSWIPLVFILSTMFAINSGIRAVTWTLLSEVFPMTTRAVATGTIGAISYGFGFASNKTFLATVSAITLSGVFLLYGLFGFVSLIVVYFFVPETEGKTLQEIENHFSGRIKMDNKVKQKQSDK